MGICYSYFQYNKNDGMLTYADKVIRKKTPGPFLNIDLNTVIFSLPKITASIGLGYVNSNNKIVVRGIKHFPSEFDLQLSDQLLSIPFKIIYSSPSKFSLGIGYAINYRIRTDGWVNFNYSNSTNQPEHFVNKWKDHAYNSSYFQLSTGSPFRSSYFILSESAVLFNSHSFELSQFANFWYQKKQNFGQHGAEIFSGGYIPPFVSNVNYLVFGIRIQKKVKNEKSIYANIIRKHH